MGRTHGHDIDTAELLSDHDRPCSDISPPKSGYREDISESGKVIRSLECILLFKDLTMGVELSSAPPRHKKEDTYHIPSSLNFGFSESTE